MTSPWQLVWGCDSTLQYETEWINYLLSCNNQCMDYSALNFVPGLASSAARRVFLVESGLHTLTRTTPREVYRRILQERSDRIEALRNHSITLLHLSDEEGNDAKSLYPLLPSGSVVWRNFGYPHLQFAGLRINSFPIGPRGQFISSSVPEKLSSERTFPWAFMGTIWKSGSRKLATSIFLKDLPAGLYFGGSSFGLGVPIADYQEYLLDSVFALCPEGDRHLDTFRIYESLESGCIPLVVDRDSQALPLLGIDFPIPLFSSWYTALVFVQKHLKNPSTLDLLQEQIYRWWSQRKATLSRQMTELNYAHPTLF